MLASKTLRRTIRLLSECGITYSQIADEIDSQWGWNSNAIKQLVVRKESRVRKSSKNTALVRVVERLAIEVLLPLESDKFDDSDLERIRSLANGVENYQESDVDLATKRIGQRFQTIRKRSALYQYPDRAAFVRWDWKQTRLITVLIDTRKGTNGHVFTMKISGQVGRRIVVGDILETSRNTYYSGLVYEVSEEINYDRFYDLDAFDAKAVERITGPNEIGLECFCISNQYLNQRVAPAPFHGLDGRGKPISGMGVFVKAPAFAELGIEEDDFSSVECTIRRKPLTDIMNNFAAITIGPTTSAQFTPDAELSICDLNSMHSGKFGEQADYRAECSQPNGWAFLRGSEGGTTKVYFPREAVKH